MLKQTKPFVSLEFTSLTLQRLCTILLGVEYNNTYMSSLMTLAVEHFYATTHLKTLLMSQLLYSIEFMKSITECAHGQPIILQTGRGVGIHQVKILYILTKRSLTYQRMQFRLPFQKKMKKNFITMVS